jgi:hypothetical protein
VRTRAVLALSPPPHEDRLAPAPSHCLISAACGSAAPALKVGMIVTSGVPTGDAAGAPQPMKIGTTASL